jgi:hypothetical protein
MFFFAKKNAKTLGRAVAVRSGKKPAGIKRFLPLFFKTEVVLSTLPWLAPFSPASPWNTSITPQARYAAPAPDLLAGHALIHAGTWGMPLYRATQTDPWARVWDAENQRMFHIRLPPEARPDPMGDAHLFVGAPDGRAVLEMYRARILPGRFILARRAFRVDLTGLGMFLRDGRFPGVRAMDASGMGGLLRAWELRAGRINHALTFLLPPGRLRHGPVWPSAREDFWGVRDYKGSIPIGTLIAIPRGENLDRLGLSRPGLALARALRDYGAYCDDSVGTDGIVLTAEGAAEPLPELAAMRADFPRIRAMLRVVLNNGPGGAGALGAGPAAARP